MNKIKSINQDNSDFLQQQMLEKKRRQDARRMNKQEFMYNKPLLKEINEKKKVGSVGGGSEYGASQ